MLDPPGANKTIWAPGMSNLRCVRRVHGAFVAVNRTRFGGARQRRDGGRNQRRSTVLCRGMSGACCLREATVL